MITPHAVGVALFFFLLATLSIVSVTWALRQAVSEEDAPCPPSTPRVEFIQQWYDAWEINPYTSTKVPVMRRDPIEVVKNHNDSWSFLIKSTTGQVIAHSDDYPTEQAALDAVADVRIHARPLPPIEG